MIDLKLWKAQKKALHITFDELAERSNLAISTLKAIFGGTTTDPRIETVQAIEQALELYTSVTKLENAPYPQGDSLTERERILIKTYRKMPEYLQNVAFNTIEQMANSFLKETTTT